MLSIFFTLLFRLLLNGKTPGVPNFRFFNRWHCYFHFGSMMFSTRANSDKNDRCAFRGSRGEVMIFFEKNKRAGVKKVFIHVYTLIVYLRG